MRTTAHHTTARHDTQLHLPQCPGGSCTAIGKSWHPVHAAPTRQQRWGGQAALALSVPQEGALYCRETCEHGHSIPLPSAFPSSLLQQLPTPIPRRQQPGAGASGGADADGGWDSDEEGEDVSSADEMDCEDDCEVDDVMAGADYGFDPKHAMEVSEVLVDI